VQIDIPPATDALQRMQTSPSRDGEPRRLAVRRPDTIGTRSRAPPSARSSNGSPPPRRPTRALAEWPRPPRRLSPMSARTSGAGPRTAPWV